MGTKWVQNSRQFWQHAVWRPYPVSALCLKVVRLGSAQNPSFETLQDQLESGRASRRDNAPVRTRGRADIRRANLLSTARSATLGAPAAYGEPKAPVEAQAVGLHPLRRRPDTPSPSCLIPGQEPGDRMAGMAASSFSKRPARRSEHCDDLPRSEQDFPANRHGRVYEPYGR
jgi:hypothetical protein